METVQLKFKQKSDFLIYSLLQKMYKHESKLSEIIWFEVI